jgi:hypothetical protein
MKKIFFNTEGYIIKISEESNFLNLNIEPSISIVKDISDEEYNSIRQNFKKASLINNVVVFEDLDPISFADSEGLFFYLSNGVLPLLNAFLKQKLNKDNPMWNDLNTYKLFLDNTISGQNEITYPINSSWEKYCSDNSINYFHTLQIP